VPQKKKKVKQTADDESKALEEFSPTMLLLFLLGQ
jgi:hypothetical protein